MAIAAFPASSDTSTSHGTNDLRNRGHLFQLPEYATDLRRKKSFIIGTQYKYV